MLCFKSKEDINVFDTIYKEMEANNWKIHENRKNIIDQRFCIPHKLNHDGFTKDLTNYLKNSINAENTMTICYTIDPPPEPAVIGNSGIYAIATVKYINDDKIEITCLCTNKELDKVNAGKFCLKKFFKILDSTRLYIQVVLETIKSIDSVVSNMYERDFLMTKIDSETIINSGSKHTHFLQFPRNKYRDREERQWQRQSQYISQSRGRSQSRGQSRYRSRSRSRDQGGGGKRTKRNNKKCH